MPGASQRFGIEHRDLDLEHRLRRIEQALEQKADANTRADVWGAINLPVPRVTGLALSEAVNGWMLEWTPSDISDLRKYEIRVSENLNFQIFKEYETRTNRVTFADESEGATTLYIKVRAVSLFRKRSIWSSIVDTTSGGLIDTGGIEIGAITKFTEWTQEDADVIHIYNGGAGNAIDDPIPAATSDTFGPIAVSASADGIIVPFIEFKVEYQSIWYARISPNYNVTDLTFEKPDNRAEITIRRRQIGSDTDVVIQTMTLDYFITHPHSHIWWDLTYWKELRRGIDTTTGSLNVPMQPDQPGAGTFEYYIDVEIISDPVDCFLYFYPYFVRVRFFEHKA